MRTVPCETCHKEPASSLSWFGDRSRPTIQPLQHWKLVGNCTSATESVYILLDEYFGSPEQEAYWRNYLGTKHWFDSVDFDAAVRRFQTTKNKRCPTCGAK